MLTAGGIIKVPSMCVIQSPTVCGQRYGGRNQRRRRFADRGGAALEFALVAPLLFMTVITIIEFGRAMMVVNVVATAAREGARAGAVPNATSSDIRAAVTSELTANSVPSQYAVITILVNNVAQDASTATTGKPISVQVTVPYANVSWIPAPFFLGSAQMKGRAVMRRE
jgi:Flp pilus assembly protein TadG